MTQFPWRDQGTCLLAEGLTCPGPSRPRGCWLPFTRLTRPLSPTTCVGAALQAPVVLLWSSLVVAARDLSSPLVTTDPRGPLRGLRVAQGPTTGSPLPPAPPGLAVHRRRQGRPQDRPRTGAPHLPADCPRGPLRSPPPGKLCAEASAQRPLRSTEAVTAPSPCGTAHVSACGQVCGRSCRLVGTTTALTAVPERARSCLEGRPGHWPRSTASLWLVSPSFWRTTLLAQSLGGRCLTPSPGS